MHKYTYSTYSILKLRAHLSYVAINYEYAFLYTCMLVIIHTDFCDLTFLYNMLYVTTL